MSIPTELGSDSKLEISTGTASEAFWRISSAFEKFKSRLSPEDAANLATVSKNDYFKSLEISQPDRAHKEVTVNLERLRPLADRLQQLEKVLGVFLNVSPYLSPIWGAIKLVLQVWDTIFKRYIKFALYMGLL